MHAGSSDDFVGDMVCTQTGARQFVLLPGLLVTGFVFAAPLTQPISRNDADDDPLFVRVRALDLGNGEHLIVSDVLHPAFFLSL